VCVYLRLFHSGSCIYIGQENIYNVWSPSRYILTEYILPDNPVDFSPTIYSDSSDETPDSEKDLKALSGIRTNSIPNARLLALHAACTHVSHLSGVGKKEEEREREVEEKQVPSSDGSDFGLLHDLLESISRRNGS